MISVDERSKKFTPAVAKQLCMARIWGSGLGGQCSHVPVTDGLCQQHADMWNAGKLAHGRVDGSVPEAKLAEFERAAASRQSTCGKAKQATKPAAKPASKPSAKPASKPTAKPATKTAAKPAAKATHKKATKATAKPATTVRRKPAAKVATKPSGKKDAKLVSTGAKASFKAAEQLTDDTSEAGKRNGKASPKPTQLTTSGETPSEPATPSRSRTRSQAAAESAESPGLLSSSAVASDILPKRRKIDGGDPDSVNQSSPLLKRLPRAKPAEQASCSSPADLSPLQEAFRQTIQRRTQAKASSSAAASPTAKASSSTAEEKVARNEVSSELQCMARTWGGGRGGRCALDSDEAGGLCKRHQTEANKHGGLPSHGRIDGPIPEKKRKEFEKAAEKGGWAMPPVPAAA